jgi:amidase
MRIDQVNPILKAVTEVNPAALDQARELDLLREKGEVMRQTSVMVIVGYRSKKLRSHLHGIPVIVKDNIGTLDMNTTSQ